MQQKYNENELNGMLKRYTTLQEQHIESININSIPIRNDDLILNEDVSLDDEEVRRLIPITSLINWTRKYNSSIPDNIKIVKFDISGISKDEYLLLKIPLYKNGIMLDDKKELIMFKNAHSIPVLDLNISEIMIYNSGIKMVHPFMNGFIKCYIGKNYIVTSMVADNRIPYYITKVRGSNHDIIFKENNIDIDQVLEEDADREIIKTLYPIISKYKNWNDMIKNRDVCNYFISLQEVIRDNYHHIKLDNIMIGILTGKFPANHNFATHVYYQ